MFQVMFHIGSLEIHTYTIICILSIIFSLYLLAKITLNKKLSLKFLTNYLPLIIIFTFLFARIGGILELSEIYFKNPIRILDIFDEAYNLYFWVFGFLFVFAIITNYIKEIFWVWLDLFVFPFLLFFMFLSVADLCAGYNYWVPSDLPFAISFNLPEVHYTVPVHPVQIYEAVSLILLMVVLLFITNKKREPWVLGLYSLLGFFAIQLCLTFFRSTDYLILFGIKLPVLLSFLFVSISIIFIILKTHSHMYFLHHNN